MLYITPVVQFASGSAQVYPIPIPVTVNPTTGIFTVSLYPNDTSVPGLTWYIVQWQLNGPPGYPGPGPTEYWVVPTSGSPVGLATVRAAPQAVPQAVIALAQLTCPGACTTGQTIVWSGTAWTNGVEGVPCTITALTIKTCTHNLNSLNVIVSVVDGSGNAVRPKSIQVQSVNVVQIQFDASFTGTAYIK